MSAQPAMVAPPDFPPSWASGWGEDLRGVYVELRVWGVRFELRWIAPGSFQMGSPKDEAGRWEDEGPQHLVTLTHGFWLAATPCTQEQWRAVTGGDPSQFKGPNRPVENVSWGDCVDFCGKLNALLPGLGASLPKEAQWEYACRAGTISAFNDGSDCTKPSGKDPALERLGWYDENSGGQTHPVGEKAPNAWGLYDMHGSVWEWCRDSLRRYSPKAETDPVGPTEGARRVVRGGSFWTLAGRCRSAYRGEDVPGYRGRGQGFRLAAGQPEARGAEGRQAGGAERRAEGRGPAGRPSGRRGRAPRG